MSRPNSPFLTALTLLLCSVAPAPTGLAARAEPAEVSPTALEALGRTTRTLDDVEMSFVYVERIAAAGDLPAHSHAHRRDYVFSGEGYGLRSEALDPIVTPSEQLRTGCVMAGGQDLTVLYDGSVELYHEDLPETDDDHVIVTPLPTRLGDLDPRQFGLCALLVRSVEEVVPLGEGRYSIVQSGGQRFEVDLDLERMVCRRLAAFSCGGRLLGEYTFSDFVRVAGGAHGTSFLYPARTELVRYDPKAADHVSKRVTFLLRSVRTVPPVDFAQQIRSRPIPPDSLVNDRRYVPEIAYRAGRTGGPAVTLEDLGRTYLDRIEAEVADEVETASPPPAPNLARNRGFEIAGLAIVVLGLLWTRRAARAERDGARTVASPGAGGPAALLLLAALSSPLEARSDAGPGIGASPAAVRRDGVEVHDVLREVVTLRNPGAGSIAIQLDPGAEFLTVWPRGLTLPADETADVTLLLAVPAGRESIDTHVRVTGSGPDGEVAFDVPLHVSVSAPVERAEARPDEPIAPPPPAGPLPHLATDAPVLDLGAMLDTDERQVTFEIRNDGDATLEIRSIEKDCGCVTAELTSSVLLPGAAGALTVLFAPEARRGPVRRHVYLTTNDPRAPITAFVIAADVTPSIRFEPERLELGRVAPGEEITALLSVRTVGAPPVLRRVSSDQLPVVDHVTVADGDEGASVAVILRADAQGAIDGELDLEFEGRTHALPVPYRVLVRGAAHARPSELGLAFVDRSRPEAVAAEFALFADTPGEVLSVDRDETRLAVVPVDPRDGERARFRVHVAPGAGSGFVAAEIRIATTWDEAPVVVPVRGFVGG
ncbi:MAG: DUF1573 domain-containing protein [Planctomycetota bacterium JB042]